jgi:hypothetical protein
MRIFSPNFVKKLLGCTTDLHIMNFSKTFISRFRQTDIRATVFTTVIIARVVVTGD